MGFSAPQVTTPPPPPPAANPPTYASGATLSNITRPGQAPRSGTDLTSGNTAGMADEVRRAAIGVSGVSGAGGAGGAGGR